MNCNSALTALLQGEDHPLYKGIDFSLISDVNKKLKTLVEASSMNKSGIHTEENISDVTHHVFEETKYIDNLEILTDSGFVPIKSVSKTIEYDVWEVILSSGKSLKCADDHIVFIGEQQTYVKDLSVGDKIKTVDGDETVISVRPLGIKDKLYDVEVNDFSHRFYSNGILSHNSLVISNLAVRSSSLGSNVGIYSVELGDRKYVKRLGSNMFAIPFTYYNDFVDEESTQEIQKQIDDYRAQNPTAGTLVVKEAPTGSQTVYDIENYFLKEEKKRGIHFDVIFVDYVNLLRDTGNETNIYMKIKKICEGLRKIAQRNNWCVVTATQANKQSFTTDDLQLDSVAESSGLVATVDTLIGLSSDSEEQLKMKVVANRDNGHMGSYAMYVKNFEFYRIEEDCSVPGGDDYMFNLDNTKDMIKKIVNKNYDVTKAKMWTPEKNTEYMIDGQPVFKNLKHQMTEEDRVQAQAQAEEFIQQDDDLVEEMFNLGENDPLSNGSLVPSTDMPFDDDYVPTPNVVTEEPPAPEQKPKTFLEVHAEANTFIPPKPEDGKKDFKEKYESMTKSEWFKKAYEGKSAGEMMPIENPNFEKPSNDNNYSSQYIVNTFKTKEEHDSMVNLDARNVTSVFDSINAAIVQNGNS